MTDDAIRILQPSGFFIVNLLTCHCMFNDLVFCWT